MKKTHFLVILLLLLFPIFILFETPSFACGHEGAYAGIGYEQLFMYTPEDQLSPRSGTSQRVTFGPGYGGTALVGYDFKGSRWGMQFPFEYSILKLNGDEWVNYFGVSGEAVFHIKEWSNGLDFHLVGGVGWAYLTEGKYYDQTKSNGITASLGPGLSYYFTRTEKISGSVTLEVPFRFTNFFKDRLSKGGTSVAAFPIRLMMQIGF